MSKIQLAKLIEELKKIRDNPDDRALNHLNFALNYEPWAQELSWWDAELLAGFIFDKNREELKKAISEMLPTYEDKLEKMVE